MQLNKLSFFNCPLPTFASCELYNKLTKLRILSYMLYSLQLTKLRILSSLHRLKKSEL